MSVGRKQRIAEVAKFLEANQGFVYSYNPSSYHYQDVIEHIPIQKASKQSGTFAYRTNQMIKHQFEYGHMTLPELTKHTDVMNKMSDKEAYEYALANFQSGKNYRQHGRGRHGGRGRKDVHEKDEKKPVELGEIEIAKICRRK